MRRAGAGPERNADGSWSIPGDHLVRAEAFAQRQRRDRPVALSILSSRQVGDLAAIEAPTWLDRKLASGAAEPVRDIGFGRERSEEHTSELQSLMRISYAVFCWKK